LPSSQFVKKVVNCDPENNTIMSTVELRKKLIETIQKTDNPVLLEEAYRLLTIESEDIDIYKLSDDQRRALIDGRNQINSGQFLTDEQANNEIDEWLSK
jgi:hypothetical protein